MKKRVEKALEYKVATSQKAVGVAIVLICAIVSNHDLFTKIKTTAAKFSLLFALIGLVLCIFGGILVALAVPAQLEPTPKYKKKFSTQNKDFRLLALMQFGSLAVAIICILFILTDNIQ